jgi:hypothetical protein
VRKGLKGREAVAAKIIPMALHGDYFCRDGTPAKPGFLRYSAKNAPKKLPAIHKSLLLDKIFYIGL